MSKRLNTIRKMQLFFIAVYRMIKDNHFIVITFNDDATTRSVYKTDYTTRVENVVLKNTIRLNEYDSEDHKFLDEFKN